MPCARGQTQAAISEINVTPLIDVMLCLLIIFMLAMPMLNGRVLLDLPQNGDPPPTTSPAPPMQLRILADGRLLLDQHPITAELLAAEMSYQVARDEFRVLAIQVDRDTEYKRVVEVLASAKDQGVTRIAMN
jgi:biopolymer transport protein ExbD